MKGHRPLMWFLIAGISLILILGVCLVLFLDLNRYKAHIEEAASGVLKREVSIKGEIGLHLLPPVGVDIRDIHIKGGPGFSEKDLVFLDRIEVGLNLLPLLRKKIRVRRVHLTRPVIRLERNARGLYNYESPEKKEKQAQKTAEEKDTTPVLTPFRVDQVLVSKGDFVFLDGKSNRTHRVREFDIDLKDLRFLEASFKKGEPAHSIFRDLLFHGTAGVKALESGNWTISDLALEFSGEKGTVVLDPIRCNFLGSAAAGRLNIDMTGKEPLFELSQEIRRLDLDRAAKVFLKGKYIKGPLRVSAHIKAKGIQLEDLLKTLSGRVTARGKGLTLYRYDIDTILAQYEKTQNVDLVDLGAVFLVGPLGILLTKGFDAARGYKGLGSTQTRVTRFVSEWGISNGVARAKDVALSTPKNRIAVKGNLVLARGGFEDFVVAVLDEKGCAKYTQKIKGTFQRPRLEKAEFAAKTLTGMVTSLFRKAKKMVVKPQCPVFYKGSVPHPAGN
jgi:uncharacterized protein involved in outer membrane biogenesis